MAADSHSTCNVTGGQRQQIDFSRCNVAIDAHFYQNQVLAFLLS